MVITLIGNTDSLTISVPSHYARQGLHFYGHGVDFSLNGNLKMRITAFHNL